MKRFLAILIVLIMVLPIFALAESFGIDLSKLTNDELLALEMDIDAEKIDRKMVKSARLGAGSYTVGIDIPAGSYTITDDGKYSMNIFVYKDKAAQEDDYRTYNLLLWSNGEKTGKIDLEEGNILVINAAIILTVFDGIVWE